MPSVWCSTIYNHNSVMAGIHPPWRVCVNISTCLPTDFLQMNYWFTYRCICKETSDRERERVCICMCVCVCARAHYRICDDCKFTCRRLENYWPLLRRYAVTAVTRRASSCQLLQTTMVVDVNPSASGLSFLMSLTLSHNGRDMSLALFG